MRSRNGEYPSWYDDEPDEVDPSELEAALAAEEEQFRLDALLDLDQALAVSEGWS